MLRPSLRREVGKMPSMKELESWQTTGQVAEELGVTRQRVLRLAEEQRLRSVLVGGVTRIYDPKSVEGYAADRRASRDDAPVDRRR